MLNIITELLQDPQLQQQVKQAIHPLEVVRLLTAAGAEKGYRLTADAISQVVAQLSEIRASELSEEELLGVSGGTQVRCVTRRDCSLIIPY